MDYTDFNYELCTRFISDYKFPIVVMNNSHQFQYEIDFYEDTFGTKTKWMNLVDIINSDYDGRPGCFLDDYYKIRDMIIKYIEELDSFQQFNNDIDTYKLWKSISYPKSKYKSPYNGETVGKQFIAIDMKKANFQALKYMKVLEDETYLDLISHFASGKMLEYIAESKYTRQVIFGKLNPSRQITVEKMIMNDVYNNIVKPIYNGELIYFGADEFIIQVSESDDIESISEQLKNAVCEAPVELKVEPYRLTGYSLYVIHNNEHKHKITDFYIRNCDDNYVYKCLPDLYSKLTRKLLAGEMLTDEDRTVVFNDCKARLLENFCVELIQ